MFVDRSLARQRIAGVAWPRQCPVVDPSPCRRARAAPARRTGSPSGTRAALAAPGRSRTGELVTGGVQVISRIGATQGEATLIDDPCDGQHERQQGRGVRRVGLPRSPMRSVRPRASKTFPFDDWQRARSSTRRSLSITWRVTFVDRHGHDHSSPRGRRSAWTVRVAGFRIPKAVMIDSRLGPDVQMVSAASTVGVRSSADFAAPARRPPGRGGACGRVGEAECVPTASSRPPGRARR